MTLKIMNSTTQAPPRCEPLNRDCRPSRSGELRSRITAKVVMPASAISAMKSWRKPSTGQWPMTGNANPGSNSAPYASTYTVARMRNAQNTKKCAAPGTDHLSSFFWPKTSTTWRLAAAPSRPTTPSMRPVAG